MLFLENQMAKENVNTIRAELQSRGMVRNAAKDGFYGRAINKGVSRLNAVLARRASFHVQTVTL